MYKNYLFFRDKLCNSEHSPKDFYKATGKLNVVSILLEEENPQEIFESLNSTGLDLSQADLIRNFLRRKFSWQEHIDGSVDKTFIEQKKRDLLKRLGCAF